MIEIIKGDTVIKTPKELTVKLYQKIQNNPSVLEDPVKVISIFTGLNDDEIRNQKVETINLLSTFITDKLTPEPGSGITLTFYHKEIEYGLETDFSKLSWGAWIDIEVYSNSETLHNEIHKLLAIMYRPITKKSKNGLKYEIEPYRSETVNERAELFLDLPITYWFSLSRFFLDTANAYINNIKTSLTLKKKIERLMWRGTKMLPNFLRKKLQRGFISN